MAFIYKYSKFKSDSKIAPKGPASLKNFGERINENL